MFKTLLLLVVFFLKETMFFYQKNKSVISLGLEPPYFTFEIKRVRVDLLYVFLSFRACGVYTSNQYV